MAADIRIDLQDAALKAALLRVVNTMPGGRDALPLMQSLGQVLLTGTQLRFRSGKGPDGAPWKKSVRVQAFGGQTLRDQGVLANSISWQADANSVAIGTNLVYAAIHQFGGPIRPKSAGALAFRLPTGQFVKVKKVTMPERPFLGVSDSDQQALLDRVEQFIQRGWQA